MTDFQIIKGKNAFISGATGSIGKAVAKLLAQNGCNLFITGKDKARLKEIALELSLNKINVFYLAGNLVNQNETYEVVKKAKNCFDKIDIVVNSAGVFPYIDLLNVSDNDYLDVMNINFRSAFIFTKEFATGMVQNKWGRIVNIGSSSAYNGYKNTSLYCASKHALLGFSKSTHDELKQYNVRTFCISPSSTKSKMGLATKNQDYSTFLDPDDVAKYVLFTISFNSNIISDEILLKRMFNQ